MTGAGVTSVPESKEEVQFVTLFKKTKGRHVRWVLGQILEKDEEAKDCQVQFLNSKDDRQAVPWEERKWLPVWYTSQSVAGRNGRTKIQTQEVYSKFPPSPEWEPWKSTERLDSILLENLPLARHQLTLESIERIVALGPNRL